MELKMMIIEPPKITRDFMGETISKLMDKSLMVMGVRGLQTHRLEVQSIDFVNPPSAIDFKLVSIPKIQGVPVTLIESKD
jgi:nucleoside diphosphate kinase